MATNPSAFGSSTAASRGTGLAPVFGAGTIGDTVNRVEMDADGALRFGSGSAVVDSAVSRNGVGQLLISNSLVINGAINASGVVDISAAGSGVQVKEGSNCKQGTAVLVAGSVTVANTAVTASSRIFLTSNADGGTPGFVRVSARVAGTSFTITSSSGTDTSTIAYEIFEPG
jgi:hypothetical protein